MMMSDSTRSYVFVGSRTTRERSADGAGISTYSVGPSGEWTLVSEARELLNPSYLTSCPERGVLYTVHGDSREVTALRVCDDGSLTVINTTSTHGSNPVHLTLSPDGRHLVVANYASGSVTSLPIAPDGSLGDATCVQELTGPPGPHRREQPSSRPHQVVFDRRGRFLLVPDKGVDRIWIFRFDATTGEIAPHSSAWGGSRAGAGPRHLVEHDALGLVYVVNEVDCTVATYAWEGERGHLELRQVVPAVPETYSGNGAPAGIELDTARGRLHVSVRHHDSICTFRVDPTSGLLSQPTWVGVDGVQPRFISLDDERQELLVANELSGQVRAIPLGEMTSSDGRASICRADVRHPVCVLHYAPGAASEQDAAPAEAGTVPLGDSPNSDRTMTSQRRP